MKSGDPPPIAPRDQPPARPRFSVMLPTYEPDGMLAQALASVLEQAPAEAEMQIAVIDDGKLVGIVTRHDILTYIEIHTELEP